MIITGEPSPERVDEDYSDTHAYFEESIILVHAQSFDHAYKIAERKAHENAETHTNPYGQAVELKLVEAIDCFLIGDTITNGVELYSSITPIKKEMTPSKYLMQKYEYSLDDDRWNQAHERKRIELMTVLRFEEFSKWRKDQISES